MEPSGQRRIPDSVSSTVVVAKDQAGRPEALCRVEPCLAPHFTASGDSRTNLKPGFSNLQAGRAAQRVRPDFFTWSGDGGGLRRRPAAAAEGPNGVPLHTAGPPLVDFRLDGHD